MNTPINRLPSLLFLLSALCIPPLLHADPPVTTAYPVHTTGANALAGSYSVSGTVSTTGSGAVQGNVIAASVGRSIVAASGIQATGTVPAFVGNYLPLSDSNGLCTGVADDTAALQHALDAGNIELDIDRSCSATQLVLHSGDILKVCSGCALIQRPGSNCWFISPNYLTFVNQSGSTGIVINSEITATTGTSANTVGYGTHDLGVEGPGMIIGNSYNQVNGGLGYGYPPNSVYTLPASWGGGNSQGDSMATINFAGVDGFFIKDLTIAAGCGFCPMIGNCRNGLISNLTITDRNLHFPWGIPFLTGSNPGQSAADGIHMMGSVHDVEIDNYTRLYGGDLTLEIGPGDGQSWQYTPGTNGVHYDVADLWFYCAGDDYNIRVNGYLSNGGGIGLIGETACQLTGTAIMWTGTLSYSGSAGQIYQPVIPSAAHDISFADCHISGTASDGAYAFNQPYAFITESYSDSAPAGYPAAYYNISVDGFRMDANTQLPQEIDVTGSNWVLRHISVPALYAWAATPEYGVSRVIQSGGIVSGLTIDDVDVGGTSNAIYPSCVFQAGGTTTGLVLSNCREHGVTYLATAVNGGVSTIAGAGNDPSGLTALTGTFYGSSFSPATGQFAPPAGSITGGSAMLAVNGTNSINLAATSGTSSSTVVVTGSGAGSTWAFPGSISTTSGASISNGAFTFSVPGVSTAGAWSYINAPANADACTEYNVGGTQYWITGGAYDFSSTIPYIIYNQANGFTGEEITAGDVTTLSAGTLTVTPASGVAVTGSGSFTTGVLIGSSGVNGIFETGTSAPSGPSNTSTPALWEKVVVNGTTAYRPLYE